MAEGIRLTVPLNALRAFEATARHLSVKQAAAEIGVTPSAISHQIRGLEDLLGVALLRRAGPGLELTEAGRALAPGLIGGFQQIGAAVAGLQAERKTGPLRLTLLPSFAALWLSPRLPGFPLGRAGFELAISTSQQALDLVASEADVAIRHGQGTWPGLRSDLLFEETVGLFGRPDPAGPQGRARIAVSTLFLSQHRQADFARWNAALPDGPVQPRGITLVDSAGLSLTAARDGAGLALAGCEIAACEVAAGRLALVLDHRIAGTGGYWLAYPEALVRDHRLRNLRDWLLREAQTTPPLRSGPKPSGDPSP